MRSAALFILALFLMLPAAAFAQSKGDTGGYAGLIAPRHSDGITPKGKSAGSDKDLVPGVIAGRKLTPDEERRRQLIKNINTVDKMREEAVANMAAAYDKQQKAEANKLFAEVMKQQEADDRLRARNLEKIQAQQNQQP